MSDALAAVLGASDIQLTFMRRPLQRILRVSAVALAMGCVAEPPRAEPVRPTRSADQCRAVIDSVGAGLVAVEPPRPTYIVRPPRSPSALRGQAVTLRFEVDTAGRVVADRILVTGIADEVFAAKLKDSARSYRFRPAAASGCAIHATHELVHIL